MVSFVLLSLYPFTKGMQELFVKSNMIQLKFSLAGSKMNLTEERAMVDESEI